MKLKTDMEFELWIKILHERLQLKPSTHITIFSSRNHMRAFEMIPKLTACTVYTKAKNELFSVFKVHVLTSYHLGMLGNVERHVKFNLIYMFMFEV